MKKLFLLIAVMAFMVHTAGAQMFNPVIFSVAENRITDTEIEIVFTGQVEEGWHVYGVDIPAGGPTAAKLTLETCQGAELKGELRAIGDLHREMDNLFGMEVSFMEGKAVFAQTLTLTDSLYNISGYLTYGACNNENCMPPTDVDFAFSGSKSVNEALVEEATEQAPASEVKPEQKAAASSVSSWWKPVVQELHSFGDEMKPVSDTGLWSIFLLGFLGGFVALLTPCVWPIIPMTVSFFLKRSSNRQKGIRDAVIYGISIIVIYVSLGLLVTLLFGASALNSLSTNAAFNIFFFLMLLVFGASFLGGFEITLPSSWSNAVDRKSENTTGLLSIFLMAFTLSLVSFSCTGPIIGFLLVEIGSTGGASLAPVIGMLGFALALALPFTLFAMFPAWLKSAPKSGNWMNVVKVSLGILELAFSLKFLSVADLTKHWGILDREVFLALWIVLFALLGAYLIGWIRFPHDEDEYDEEGNVIVVQRTSVPRFFMALLAFAFAIYMVPGLWGAPCKAVSAFAPPMNTQDFNLSGSEVEARFTDYEEGMSYAKSHGLPVMLDFTGYGCVNCRKMEAAVWTDSRVAEIMNEKYVLITLYVDDRTPLAEPIVVEENGVQNKLRTQGDRWSYLQRSKFGANAQPFYVLVDNDGMPLNTPYSYDEDVEKYVKFLNTGLKNYKR
jgi:thiol:disulfide interchange protein DsbD